MKNNWRLLSLSLVCWLSLTGLASAVKPDEMLPDPAMERRARVLGQELRCLVCQNQSIDDSDADLARDLRILLRQRLVAGDTDAQAKQYLVDRYGAYVLLKPPFNGETLLLWLGPALLLCGAGGALAVFFRRRSKEPLQVSPLSESEHHRLNALLKGDGSV